MGADFSPLFLYLFFRFKGYKSGWFLGYKRHHKKFNRSGL